MLNFIKKYKFAWIAAVVVIAALVIAFVSGGNVEQTAKLVEQSHAVLETAAPTEATQAATQKPSAVTESTTQKPTESVSEATTAAATTAPTQSATQSITQEQTQSRPVAASSTETKKDKYKTDPIPPGKPAPVEPQEQEIKDETLKCTLSISCATILDNMDKLDEDLWELVPEDGWLLKPVSVEFQVGESVFDILKRVCKEEKIHLEFSFTPMYNTAYIEGIGNLYEFDCGSNSGWMYRVNDWYPNYGCSRYAVKSGDVIEWKYTCNLGYDIGGGNVSYTD